jgi:radical SAM protein with 4Fe4S-binding SPASM domain
MVLKFEKIHPELPIFEIPSGNISILYTPGYFTIENINQVEILKRKFSSENHEFDDGIIHKAVWLENKAVENCKEWEQIKKEEYAPECLAIYFDYNCNLSCTYCFASLDHDEKKQSSVLNNYKARKLMLLEAARIVADNCVSRMKPFNLTFQGVGEPTLYWEQVVEIFSLVRNITREYKIELKSYITTNGVLDKNKIYWLSEHFDLIGLSCDGPPDIQNSQRPLANGEKSCEWIENTARTIANAGGSFEVRSTISPISMTRQNEIIRYIIEKLNPTKIRFEPVYRNSVNGFRPEHANIFVEHFLKAQKISFNEGYDLSISGIRLDELHGPYCDVSRNTLRITPEGKIINCIFLNNWNHSKSQPHIIANFNEQKKKIVFDQQLIRSLKSDSLSIPDQCLHCINMFHCTKGCPDHCYNNNINDEPPDLSLKKWNKAAEFRCQVFQKLAVKWIIDIALNSTKDNKDVSKFTKVENPESEKINAILISNTLQINKDYIIKQYESVTGKYPLNTRSLPKPVWEEFGYDIDGEKADTLLKNYMQKENVTPLSIYIHIPFCDRRCGFCDCYSIPLSKADNEIEEKFVSCILNEIESRYYGNLQLRPVTTIHFGGGTPNSLNYKHFESIVKKCKDSFNIDYSTEIAIETTSSHLSDIHLQQLKDLGFRRLHVGVQTLQNNIRKLIGRYENANEVIQKLKSAMQCGFITSVDIIYGLPGQTLKGVIDTLSRLVEINIHGISLYHLNLSKRNYSFLNNKIKYRPDLCKNYVLFQAADQYLIQAGYKKNHFSHFAKQEDENLYYNFSRRDEDLLAMGPSADGIFENLRYRNHLLKNYIRNISKGNPSIEGGTFELLPEIKTVINSLMCGFINYNTIIEYRLEALVNQWMDHELLIEDQSKNGFYLSANGSWFISNMLSDIKRFIKQNPC